MLKYMNEYLAKKLIAGVILVLLLLSFFFIFTLGISKSEVVECQKLKSYSEKFEQFWLTEWQKEMCDSHDIEIDAPVVNNYD